ncbi:hypothetical protein HCN44_007176 [Aphidius gifuensis]|uniref:SH3 domain-containing protein n=1 Tax=Aphidius gifuensis TaxID=684658 RepID=A0A834XMU8_APHGI|nr:hypothetical protein HCN44_007176 [Aphidius gifuensis]
MGQLNSQHLRPKLSLTWVLHDVNKNDKKNIKIKNSKFNIDDNKNIQNYNLNEHELSKKKKNKKSRNNQDILNNYNKVTRAISEPNLILRDSLTSNLNDKYKYHRKKRTKKSSNIKKKFKYEINDLDLFLTKASIDEPANIPIVISFTSVLYQTQNGIQDEISLPLGTIVNAIFKNDKWLYCTTPHNKEGYVIYSACLPLGILPQPTRGPCWEDTTDVFPKPLGNMTDRQNDTRSECDDRNNRYSRLNKKKNTKYDELFFDHYYKHIDNKKKIIYTRRILLYTIDHIKNWFLIQKNDGHQGFIPAKIANHGFI